MKINEAILLAIGAGLIFWPRRASGGDPAGGVSYLGLPGYPRGVRNNNPGNIKINPANNWKGAVPHSQNTDGTFEQFREYVFGVRAMIKLMQNYISQGNNTIRKIVNKYAPVSENPTSAYLNFISERTGYGPDQKITAVTYPLVSAIAQFENGTGTEWITPQQFQAANQMI